MNLKDSELRKVLRLKWSKCYKPRFTQLKVYIGCFILGKKHSYTVAIAVLTAPTIIFAASETWVGTNNPQVLSDPNKLDKQYPSIWKYRCRDF